MKKIFVVMMAFALGMAVTSCKQGQKSEAAAAEQTEGSSLEIMTNLVEKVKSEGANWSEEQWKDAYKQAFAVTVPIMKSFVEIAQAVNSETPDTAAISAAAKKAEAMEKEFKPLGELVERFDSIAKTFPKGKSVSEDKEFEKQMFKEFGFPEDFHM
jgi:hypothetical protein